MNCKNIVEKEDGRLLEGSLGGLLWVVGGLLGGCWGVVGG